MFRSSRFRWLHTLDATRPVDPHTDWLTCAKSTDPKAIRDAIAKTNLTQGPAMIVAYNAIQFEESGQNKNASLVMVQINDIGKGMERITVWPKSARRANYKPVFPTP